LKLDLLAKGCDRHSHPCGSLKKYALLVKGDAQVRVHAFLEAQLCNLNHTPNDLARIYTRWQLRVKELACEIIVIHMRTHSRETIGKKLVRDLTWKVPVIKSGRFIEIVDRYVLSAKVCYTTNSY